MYLKKALFLLSSFILMMFTLIVYPVGIAVATDNTFKEIDISTSPEKVLFNVSKLVPGDWATRTLTIENRGRQDFNYLSSAKLTNGSEKLYNELLLTISDKNSDLFKGKLSDFKKLKPRFLASKDKEDLNLTLEFPYHLGNEFQGLECEVQFSFYVEGTLGGILPADGPRLPSTGTDLFNLLVVGSALVLCGGAVYVYSKRKKVDLPK